MARAAVVALFVNQQEVHIGAQALSIVVAGASLIAPAHPHTSGVQCARQETVKHSSPFIQKVWDKRRWTRGSPSHAAIKAWRKRLGCAGPQNKRAMKQRWQDAKRSYGRYRKYRQITPYSGGGAHWAIPYCLVEAESGGSWTAYNPSGAAGPYQIMPEWGRPYPADTWREKMANHRIAGELWAGGAGASNWVTWPC